MKIITWNVQWFCGLDGIVDIARVINLAKEMADFDVICMQEVAVNYPRLDGNLGHDQPAILQSLLPGFDVLFGPAVDELAPDGRSRQRFGNLIATRFPVAVVQNFPLPYAVDATTVGLRSMARSCISATLITPLGAVRFMTTHLEFYSSAMRMAQANALIRLHAEGCELAKFPPLRDASGGPFQSKPQTAHCILTGDFNFEPASAEYALLQSPQHGASQLHDAWAILHPEQPHAPTFRLHEHRYGPLPITCDFLFVSDTLTPHLRRTSVNLETQFSDHQPILLELE